MLIQFSTQTKLRRPLEACLSLVLVKIINLNSTKELVKTGLSKTSCLKFARVWVYKTGKTFTPLSILKLSLRIMSLNLTTSRSRVSMTRIPCKFHRYLVVSILVQVIGRSLSPVRASLKDMGFLQISVWRVSTAILKTRTPLLLTRSTASY